MRSNGYNKEINVQKLGVTNENKWITYPWQNSGIDVNFKSELSESVVESHLYTIVIPSASLSLI